MSSVIHTKNSDKEVTINECIGRKYHDNSPDENGNLQNIEKHTNKYIEKNNFLTAENGL